MSKAANLVVSFVAVAMVAGSLTAEAGLLSGRQVVPPVRVAAVSTKHDESGVPKCCDERCVSYRHHGRLRKTCCGCEPPIQAVLQVVDPCCCCSIDVPVCLPACCTGPPEVCNRKGLFKRDVVEYSWCCGYRIRIVFDRCGDLTVHSYGSL